MLSKYKLSKIQKNLDYFYKLATNDAISHGYSWYSEANKYCRSLSVKYNTTTEIVAGVLSALSPRNKWEQNKKDTEKVLIAVKNNLPPKTIKVCTFNKNKQKAFDIAQGKRVIKSNSPKTYAFVKNIANLDDKYVTIDVWHLRACFNRMRIKKSLTPLEYKQVEKLTIKNAKKEGISGYQYQAIIWKQIRDTK